MTIRRLLVILAFAALVGGAWRSWNRTPLARAEAHPVAANERVRSQPEPAVSRAEAPFNFTRLSRKASAAPAVPVLLQGDAPALLAEQVALQQMAAGTDLELTAEQWSAFAAVSSHHQAIRHAFEATIATVGAAKDGRVRMEIPLYPDAGDALRARFYADLREELGGAGDEIARRMGGALEGHFAGFGVGVQTLEFVAEPRGTEADYQVTRTVKYWNSMAAGTELTTRRETHFPGLEDPAGHHWGPLLSVVAVRAAKS